MGVSESAKAVILVGDGAMRGRKSDRPGSAKERRRIMEGIVTEELGREVSDQ